MTYSEAIKKLRHKLILTQTEFGELLDVSFATVNRWKAGKHEPTTKIKRELFNYVRKTILSWRWNNDVTFYRRHKSKIFCNNSVFKTWLWISIIKSANIDFDTKIFVDRFKTSLERINKRTISKDEIFALLAEINSLIKNNNLGKEFYNRLLSSEYPIKLIKMIED